MSRKFVAIKNSIYRKFYLRQYPYSKKFVANYTEEIQDY
jgi:hypothetical protein